MILHKHIWQLDVANKENKYLLTNTWGPEITPFSNPIRAKHPAICWWSNGLGWLGSFNEQGNKARSCNMWVYNSWLILPSFRSNLQTINHEDYITNSHGFVIEEEWGNLSNLEANCRMRTCCSKYSNAAPDPVHFATIIAQLYKRTTEAYFINMV